MTITTLVSLAVGAISASIGWEITSLVRGASRRRRRQTQVDDSAAVACPTCRDLVAPAMAMLDHSAEITGVAYYGSPRDPIQNANAILRVALSHAERVRRAMEPTP